MKKKNQIGDFIPVQSKRWKESKEKVGAAKTWS